MNSSFTFNDHLEYGFANRNNQYAPNQDYFLKIGTLTRMPENPLLEATRAAHHIYDRHQDLYLLLSGGVDSEAMACAFLNAQVPFHVVIMRFENDLNLHDISHAINFCKKRNLKYELIDFNIVDYFSSGRHWPVVDDYRCTSPQLCIHIEIMKQVPGAPIMPWSPIALRNHGHGPIAQLPQDYYMSYCRYLEKNKIFGVPYFFLYTPELISSFLRLPCSLDWMKNKVHATEAEEYRLKCTQYLEGGFDILPKEKKQTGFEVVKKEFARLHNADEGVFDRLFRAPLEAKYPHPPRSRFILPQNILADETSKSYFRY